MSNLPTRDGIFHHARFELDVAYRALGDAADWLRSDWQPVGLPLTSGQAQARTAIFDAIREAKDIVNRAKAASEEAVR